MQPTLVHRPRIAALGLGVLLLAAPGTGWCWGERGHEIIGLIAAHYLTGPVRARVASILDTDTSGFANGSIADEAVWADRFRDSDRDTSQVRYRQTREWHYMDLELDHPDPDAACFGHPGLPPATAASQGPPADCIVDKIGQFRAELEDRATAPAERLRALQFVLHLVGDVHQPLHAADRHDRGGNDLAVVLAGEPVGNLHHYWDTVFVERLIGAPRGAAGTRRAAARLIAAIAPGRRRAWSDGTPAAWARQSFDLARLHTYAALPPADAARRGALPLDARYAADAERIVRMQLTRAGLRLARLLNSALGPR